MHFEVVTLEACAADELPPFQHMLLCEEFRLVVLTLLRLQERARACAQSANPKATARGQGIAKANPPQCYPLCSTVIRSDH